MEIKVIIYPSGTRFIGPGDDVVISAAVLREHYIPRSELKGIFDTLNGWGGHACYCVRSVDNGCTCALAKEWLEQFIKPKELT